MDIKGKYIIKVGIYLFLGITIILLLLAGTQFIFAKIDDNANRTFDEKARQLQLKGKSKVYVISHFGEPDYIMQDAFYETLVYIPGPTLLIWRGECRIGVDKRTGLVKNWNVNQ